MRSTNSSLFWVVTLILGAAGNPNPVGISLWVAAVLVSILVHELGHALVAKAYGWPPRITLYGMGGLAAYEPGSQQTWKSRAIIAVSGPGAGFVLAAIVIGLVLISTPALLAQDWISISPGAWGGRVFSGALSRALAYILWYYGVRHLGSSRTAVYSNLVPVAALITAWIWLSAVPSPLQTAGAAVILLGLTVARLAQSPGPSSAMPSETPSSISP